jgi:uncharacterized protein (TIRG00374 family)
MQRNIKIWTGRIFLSLLGFGILLALVYYVGFEKFFYILLNVNPAWIVIAILVFMVAWIFRILRLKAFTLHAGKNIKALDLFKLYISGYALNVLLPAKLGDAATVGYLKMKGINIGRKQNICWSFRQNRK